jgi:uroporphyrin-III C-methyltransferase/precorrin-2 dehydrogenase/sirohydrochlorin ferrochelatase
MNRLANLPVFLRLAGAKAVLAGGGEPAAWKAELLAAAGAQLAIFALAPSERLLGVAERLGLSITERAWRPSDLEGALIAVAQAQDEAEAARFRAAARGAGALVNVIDRPKFCDFSFGSIVERSPLVIAVSTDGAAPVFAQAVRARIEAMFPPPLRAWAEAARAWRPRLAEFDLARRRAIWLDFADRAFACLDRAPDEADFAALSQARRLGRLIVVGTGAGREEDMTLRAVRALQAADHVIIDGAVPVSLRDLGRREASFEVCPQGADAAVRAAAAERVAAGETVVALVAGDGRATAWEGAEIAPGVAPGFAS